MHNQKLNDRIPDIFRQKHNYQKHINKLGELSRRHSYNSSCNRQEILDQYRMRKQQSFHRKTQNNEERIIKENSKIYDKLSRGARSSLKPLSHSTEGKFMNNSPWKRKIQEKMDSDNIHIYQKLNKLTPSINNKKFQSDYEKSVQIRNRISRFEKTTSQTPSVLKLNRYFSLSSRSTPSSRRQILPVNLPSTNSKNLSSLKDYHSQTRSKLSTFKSKMNVEYRKQDINKNKVIDKWDLLKKKKYHSMFKQPIQEPIKKQKFSYEIALKRKQPDSKINDNKNIAKENQVFPTEALDQV